MLQRLPAFCLAAVVSLSWTACSPAGSTTPASSPASSPVATPVKQMPAAAGAPATNAIAVPPVGAETAADRDHDGAKERAAADRDGDGIVDSSDKCPDDPEDKDAFQDTDGCPDADNDRDGILDVDDQCPNNPETRNGKKDADGCPD